MPLVPHLQLRNEGNLPNPPASALLSPSVKRRLLIALLLIAPIVAIVFCLYPSYPNNRIPAGALQALESDSNLVLYSIYPERFIDNDNGEFQPLPDDDPKFHTYRILGQTALKSPDSRRIVVDTIRHAVRDWNGEIHGCFLPRHGIRATDSAGTHDFLICFQCRQVYVYAPDGTNMQLGISATPDQLNSILTAAHVPLPSR